MDLKQIIQNFNDGDWGDISPIFNRKIETFLNFLKGKNLLDKIDINQIPDRPEDEFPKMEFLDSLGLLDNLEYSSVPDEHSNKFLLYKLEKNPSETLNFICDKLLTGVELKGEGYYLKLKDREELSSFFKDYNRDTSPRDVVINIFNEDGWDPYWDTTNDVYGDVIEILNAKNLDSLKSYILKEIGDKELSIEDYDTEFFDTISNEDGYFTITSENVNELIRDEESMNNLFDTDLQDLKQELYSIQNNSYNAAYETEIYRSAMSKLETLFIGNIIDEVSKTEFHTHYSQYIQIRDFYNDIHKFLSTYEGSGFNEDNLDYHGSYTGIITHLMDEDQMEYLDFRIPDYPDGSVVDEYINDTFNDYI